MNNHTDEPKAGSGHYHTHSDGTTYFHCHDDRETHGHHEDSSAVHSHEHTHENGMVHSHEHAHDNAEAHDHEHNHEHVHAHGHTHSHTHTHDPKDIRKIVNRLSRSIGHLESVKRMVENNVDCSDVLIQIAAVRAELTNAGKLLLKEHLEHCIVEAVAENDPVAIQKMNEAIDKFMK
uniref:Copper-sensing transcriptional repressor CsoR n=1 Tax=Eubacterium cellulosolvens (strain ATCC 43171 / JCM 9499 / 6) TaxID=633697 RepID=I5AUG6_EUBC6